MDGSKQKLAKATKKQFEDSRNDEKSFNQLQQWTITSLSDKHESDQNIDILPAIQQSRCNSIFNTKENVMSQNQAEEDPYKTSSFNQSQSVHKFAKVRAKQGRKDHNFNNRMAF